MVTIQFGGSADRGAVSAHTVQVLTEICEDAGLDEIWISSTQRTARAQARAMYENCKAYGVAAQLKLYRAPGQEVVRVFDSCLKRSLPPDRTIDEMERKIRAVGPSRVSRHCADPLFLNVIDIPPSRMPDTKEGAFVAAVLRAVDAKKVSKFFQPPQDPAFHLEIPQRA